MRTVLVTGSTDGIGFETARQLLATGMHVLVHGRSEAKATRQANALASRVPGGKSTPVWGDLSRMREVVALAEQVRLVAPVLDVLINNAGIYAQRRAITEDGFELTMAVNHFAPYLLTRLVGPSVSKAPAGRIVTVSSMAHQSGDIDLDDLMFENGFDAYSAYATSKLANILFTRALATRLAGASSTRSSLSGTSSSGTSSSGTSSSGTSSSGTSSSRTSSSRTDVTANCLHPGVIDTKLLHAGFRIKGSSVEKGARTSVYLATSEKVAGVSGKYFDNCRETSPSRQARNDELGEALWAISERLVAEYL